MKAIVRRKSGKTPRDAKAQTGTGASARQASKRGGDRPTEVRSSAKTGQSGGQRPARTAGAAGRRQPASSAGARAKARGARAFVLEPLATRRARAAAIVSGLRRVYAEARCELDQRTDLELLVATILSAQCTDARVNMTTPALFARYRSAADYAAADMEELCGLIRSTGFFRNKARSIIALGRTLSERFGGEVPRTMGELVQLPGVGRKTANVLLAERHGEPGIAVDTHVIRLTGPVWRLTDETDPVKIEFALYEVIPEPDRAFFGIATIWHGRRLCPARSPRCGDCPLADVCPTSFSWGTTGPGRA